jgi:hypothetical protein
MGLVFGKKKNEIESSDFVLPQSFKPVLPKKCPRKCPGLCQLHVFVGSQTVAAVRRRS